MCVCVCVCVDLCLEWVGGGDGQLLYSCCRLSLTSVRNEEFQKTLLPLFLSRLQAEFTVHFDDACSRAEFTVHFDDACSRARVVTQNTPRGALSQLTLRPALRNDTGFYTCNAKNKFGHGALVSNLVVNGQLNCSSG